METMDSPARPSEPSSDVNGSGPSRVSVRGSGPRQRRTAVTLFAIALIALGALTMTLLVNTVGDRHEVLSVARDVAIGAEISDGDLAVARISLDEHVASIPASDRKSVIGMRAISTLHRGSLLTRAGITDRLIPAEGQRLLPLSLVQSQLPARGLRPGDRIQVIATPTDGAAQLPGPAGFADDPITGSVIEVKAIDSEDRVTVDVVVSEADAAPLAERARAGITVVLLPAGE